MIEESVILALNVAAGKLLAAHLELLAPDVVREAAVAASEAGVLLAGPEVLEHFTRRYQLAMYEYYEKATREQRVAPAKEWIKPMNDAETTTFLDSLVPMGQWAGWPVRSAITTNPQYFHWLASTPDTFKKDLNRYLARDQS